MRKYTAAQIIGFILSFLLPPLAIWFTEGFGIDFWINVILCFLGTMLTSITWHVIADIIVVGFIPGSIHATWVWIVWIERKWKTHHGEEVTTHPLLIFSKEFEQRSRWKGNGQDGVFGYLDDNIKGGEGRLNTVGGTVDPHQAAPIPHGHSTAV